MDGDSICDFISFISNAMAINTIVNGKYSVSVSVRSNTAVVGSVCRRVEGFRHLLEP